MLSSLGAVTPRVCGTPARSKSGCSAPTALTWWRARSAWTGEAAFGLADVERVLIRTDEHNRASAGVPPRLGYRLDQVEVRHPEAPGESGRLQIWVR
jgi:hypothetical protein